VQNAVTYRLSEWSRVSITQLHGLFISATFRSQSTLELNANWQVPNTVIRDILGFLPPGLVATGNSTIALLDDTTRLYANNGRTQIDMRFAKIVRFGRTRTDIGVDLSNLLNTNYATGYQGTYASPGGGMWNNPTTIYTPRFVRLNFPVNFWRLAVTQQGPGAILALPRAKPFVVQW